MQAMNVSWEVWHIDLVWDMYERASNWAQEETLFDEPDQTIDLFQKLGLKSQ